MSDDIGRSWRRCDGLRGRLRTMDADDLGEADCLLVVTDDGRA
jgi:hypothetical protein